MPRIIGIKPFVLLAASVLLLALAVLSHPAVSMQAAVRGIAIWWDVLFPALLPFLVISELMLGFGIVHFFGTLLDPLMRPLFRIPGIGGFVMAMGFASGYPVGARLTSQLWEQRLVGREEGERLVAFTTTSDPIFLIGAVSVGFFHDASLAVILAVAHYGSALLLGVAMRFHSKGVMSTPATAAANGGGSLLYRALQAMHQARLKDGRAFGDMLQQAINSSIQMIFVIGGLVVFFSVVLEMLTVGGLMNAFFRGVNAVLQLTGIPSPLSEAVVSGLFEVTLGAKAAGGAPGAIPLVYKAAIGAWVLSWAGLSVHAQILSVLHRTNLRYTPFLLARVIHGVLSAAAVIVFWEPLQALRGESVRTIGVFAGQSPAGLLWGWSLPVSALALIAILATISVLSGLFAAFFSKNE